MTFDLLTVAPCLGITGVCPSVEHITALIHCEPLTALTDPDG